MEVDKALVRGLVVEGGSKEGAQKCRQPGKGSDMVMGSGRW